MERKCEYCFRTVHQDQNGVWRHDVTNRSYCIITVPVKPRDDKVETMTIQLGSYVRVNELSKVYKVLKINEAEQTAYCVPAPNHPDGVTRDRVWVALKALIEVPPV